MQGSWKQIVIKFLTSWKKCGGKLEKVCANVLKSLYRLWHFASAIFVQCVEKVCTKVQKMKKLVKRKAVRVCREIRAMFVQIYRKL